MKKAIGVDMWQRRDSAYRPLAAKGPLSVNNVVYKEMRTPKITLLPSRSVFTLVNVLVQARTWL